MTSAPSTGAYSARAAGMLTATARNLRNAATNANREYCRLRGGGEVIDMEELTKEEKSAIASLKRVARKWPNSLWLFSASGSLNVMKKHADGEKAVHGDNTPLKYGCYAGMDQEYVIDSIDIENDGGDW